MTLSGGLTRPGERDRPIIKFMEVDWTFCLVLAMIAGVGGLMLFSIAGAAWEPWADRHLLRFGVYFIIMIILAMCDLRWWFNAAYPIYVVGVLLLVAVDLVGDISLGAQRWLQVGPVRFQPSEVMKIGLVLALARFYHGLSADRARMSWWLLIPAAMIGVPFLLVAKQPDLGTAILLGATGGAIMVLAGPCYQTYR